MTDDTNEGYNCLPTEAGGRRPRMIHVPIEIVEKISRFRMQGAGGTIMTQIGISDNTWRKIRAGQPIRQSVAERLAQVML